MSKVADSPSVLTEWGEKLDRTLPLDEYPRPQFMRPRWMNLNGTWDFGIAGDDAVPEKLEGRILVPFSPECALSGADRGPGPGETAWYARSFRLPEGFMQDRLLLHFGAVDQTCRVYVNGHLAGSHEGGYTPFCLDITDLFLPERENRLRVAVQDKTEYGVSSYGKQSSSPGGIWYHAQSGIWQTVWLESVPENHIPGLRLDPQPQLELLRMEIPGGGEASYAVFAQGRRVCTGTFGPDGRAELSLPGCRLWTPEDPFLYDILIRRGSDLVKSYFAMRSVRREGGELLLNGKPVNLIGLLDQGYWPDGLYTAPSDEAMVYDISTARRLGYNLLRKHVKVEPLRWYYHCDRLGMLVWQDIPNGGDSYSTLWTRDIPLVLNRQLSDKKVKRYGRLYSAGRKQFEAELEEIVDTLHNTPSVIAWTLFNEGWGQFETRRLTDRLKELDGGRLVDSASGWHDQGCGDFCSRHIYFKKLSLKPDSRIQAITECGGFGLAPKSADGRGFSYRRAGSKQELQSMLDDLYWQLAPLKQQGLRCCIYTQLTDVEEERNGLLTWDRRQLKADADRLRELNTAWKAAADTGKE